MQFSKLSAFATIAFATLAAATPTSQNDPSNECNSGALQCCDSTQSASSPSVQTLLASLGIPVGSVTGIVGLTCSPITVIGASGTSCTNQAVCCTNNNFNGVVALGCTPININA